MSRKILISSASVTNVGFSVSESGQNRQYSVDAEISMVTSGDFSKITPSEISDQVLSSLIRIESFVITMTIMEVHDEIKSKVKPYHRLLNASTYYSTLRQIRLGKAKQETIDRFYRLMGYTGSFNSWERSV